MFSYMLHKYLHENTFGINLLILSRDCKININSITSI